MAQNPMLGAELQVQSTESEVRDMVERMKIMPDDVNQHQNRSSLDMQFAVLMCRTWF